MYIPHMTHIYIYMSIPGIDDIHTVMYCATEFPQRRRAELLTPGVFEADHHQCLQEWLCKTVHNVKVSYVFILC